MNQQNHTCDENDDSKWRLIPGRDSSSTGEAKFACVVCGHEQFRGSWGSAIWLDRGEARLHSELQADADKRRARIEREQQAQRNKEWKRVKQQMAKFKQPSLWKRFAQWIARAQ